MDTDPAVTEPTLGEVTSKWADDLRALASFIELRPGILNESDLSWTGFACVVYADDAPDLAVRLLKLGSFDKIDSDYYSGGEVVFGRHRIRVQVGKEKTCEKVPTGEKVIKTKTLTDPTATVPPTARNVRTVTRTEVVYEEEEDVTEWSCGSLLNPTTGGDEVVVDPESEVDSL